MKSRLVRRDNFYQLILCNENINDVTENEIYEYLTNYKEEKFFPEINTWSYDVSMDEYDGDTIAQVSDDGILTVYDYDLYKRVIIKKEVKYISVSEYATKHGRKPAMIRRYCAEKRIKGAFNDSSEWRIPEDAPYPKDARKGKRVIIED